MPVGLQRATARRQHPGQPLRDHPHRARPLPKVGRDGADLVERRRSPSATSTTSAPTPPPSSTARSRPSSAWPRLRAQPGGRDAGGVLARGRAQRAARRRPRHRRAPTPTSPRRRSRRCSRAAVGADRADAVQVFRGDETTWARRRWTRRARARSSPPRRAVVVRNAEALEGRGRRSCAAYLDDPTPGRAPHPPGGQARQAQDGLEAAARARRRCTPARAAEGARRCARTSQEQLRRRKLAPARRRARRAARAGRPGPAPADGRAGQAGGLRGRPQGPARRAEDVAAVLGRGLAQPLYKLGDAFSRARRAGGARAAGGAARGGRGAAAILATLHRALRQVRGARALRGARAPRGRRSVLAGCGRLPFKVGDVLEAARRWSERRAARRALRALDAADRRIKTGADAARRRWRRRWPRRAAARRGG